jgi:molybdate transport system substrate-binding protein
MEFDLAYPWQGEGMMRRTSIFFLSLILLLFMLAVPGIAMRADLSVAAASDLRYAFEELGKSFEEKVGIKVKWIFGSSGILSVQIQGGMGVDLFASASPEWVDRLAGKGVVVEKSMKVFAQGRIAICTYKKSHFKIDRFEDLAKPQIKRIVIANPSHAPYGVAAKEALETIGIWEKVRSRIVCAENVLQAQAYLRRGEVDAGVIALSLANIPEIESHPIPTGLHHPIRQTIVILKGTGKKELAERFIDFLTKKEGMGILRRYGFSAP